MSARDHHRAPAWQLGRLLALQSKPFAAALYRWKRLRAQRRKSGDTTLPALPTHVTSFLDDLALLDGVPFNYLVPEESMTPVESLRFFSLYEGWLAALLDGALSIGRVTPADRRMERHPRRGPARPRRSGTVDPPGAVAVRWPDSERIPAPVARRRRLTGPADQRRGRARRQAGPAAAQTAVAKHPALSVRR
ncbi:hypothetical protein AB0M79_28765 [Polymorphospora sp. NPDC051019]|uniref:hypothetical protein n=1 Tax=Polymorphospora sp. NPDC051019 TaxID=3155725 RepID=UPI003443E229